MFGRAPTYGTTPVPEGTPQAFANQADYNAYLDSRAMGHMPPTKIIVDQAGNEVTAGYAYLPEVLSFRPDEPGRAAGVYKVTGDGGYEAAPGFSQTTRGYKVGDRRTRTVGNPNSDGGSTYDESYDPFAEVMYSKSLHGLDANKIGSEYQKYQSMASDIDPRYAQLFRGVDLYHEGRWGAEKDPTRKAQLLGETLQQWQKDNAPDGWDRLHAVAPLALMFVPGMQGLAGSIGSAVTGGMATGATATGIGGGMLTGGLGTLAQGGDLGDIIRNSVKGGALGGVGSVVAEGIGKSNVVQQALGPTGSQIAANLGSTAATGVASGKGVDLERLGLSAAGQLAGSEVAGATGSKTLGGITNALVQSGGNLDPLQLALKFGPGALTDATRAAGEAEQLTRRT